MFGFEELGWIAAFRFDLLLERRIALVGFRLDVWLWLWEPVLLMRLLLLWWRRLEVRHRGRRIGESEPVPARTAVVTSAVRVMVSERIVSRSRKVSRKIRSVRTKTAEVR